MQTDVVSVPLSYADFIRLHNFLVEHGASINAVEAVSLAVDYWLDNASWKEEDLIPQNHTGGIKWGRCHMPEETELRMHYAGQYHHAKVEKGNITYKGKRVESPSRLARVIANNTSRNARRDLEIKLPQTNTWQLASNLV